MALLHDLVSNMEVPVVRPELVGGLGQGGLCDEFVARFGTDHWKKTPAKNCWYIATDGMQFTVVHSLRYELDFAFYDYDTVAEFRDAFENRTHVGDAIYFQMNNTGVQYKYPALRIIAFLKERGLW